MENIENLIDSLNMNISEIEYILGELNSNNKISMEYEKFELTLVLTLANLSIFKSIVEKAHEEEEFINEFKN